MEWCEGNGGGSRHPREDWGVCTGLREAGEGRKQAGGGYNGFTPSLVSCVGPEA